MGTCQAGEIAATRPSQGVQRATFACRAARLFPSLPVQCGVRLPARAGPAPRRARPERGSPAPVQRRGPKNSLRELALERLLDTRVHELRHVAAEARDLADQARAEIGEIERG